jgi:hypothetical protein
MDCENPIENFKLFLKQFDRIKFRKKLYTLAGANFILHHLA